MSLYQRWLEELTKDDAQLEAFKRTGHTVVIAGPGSGKTRVLALKIAQLLREEIASPQGVACLTYTRMMAQELERRLAALGASERPNVFIGTVHGFCLSQVVQPFSDVYDLELPRPLRVAAKRLQDECKRLAYRDVFKTEYDSQRNWDFGRKFDRYRRQRADIPFARWRDHRKIADVISQYERRLIDSGYVDFDIIVHRALRLIIDQALVRQSLNAKYAWLAVDEYQDLGYPLSRIVTELLDRTTVKLFAVGDPAQAIFDFAGTDPKYLTQLASRPDVNPTVMLLQNYRSTREIVTVSQAVLGEIQGRYCQSQGGRCKVYECPRGAARQAQVAAILVQRYMEAGYPLNQIAVLHRKRDDLEQIGQHLDQRSIDFAMDKHPLYDRSMVVIRWLEDLAYWCLKGFGTQDSTNDTRGEFGELLATWKQIGQINTSMTSSAATQNRAYLAEVLWRFRGQDPFLGDWLPNIAESLGLDDLLNGFEVLNPDEVEEYQKLRQLVQPGQPLNDQQLSRFANLVSSVQLTTLHSSKGTEFDVVIIAGVEQIEVSANGRRLLYVGATRARHDLCLLYTKNPAQLQNAHPILPRYIKELKAEARSNRWSFFQHNSV